MYIKSLCRHILIAFCVIVSVFMLSGCGGISFVISEPLEEKTYTAQGGVNVITVDNYRMDVVFSVSSDDSIHIVYYENTKYKFDINESDDGILSIIQQDIKYVSVFELPSKTKELSIAVPASFSGNIGINSNRANIAFYGTHSKNLDINSDRAEIELSDILISENLNIDGYRSKITVTDTKVDNNISVETQRDDISFQNLEFGCGLKVVNYRGNIDGTIKGVITDYSIISKIRRGESSLPGNMPGGDKQMYVEANRGDISISFVNTQDYTLTSKLSFQSGVWVSPELCVNAKIAQNDKIKIGRKAELCFPALAIR